MKRWKKILRLLLYVFGYGGIIFLMAFAGRKHAGMTVGQVDVFVDPGDNSRFVTQDDVMTVLKENNIIRDGIVVGEIDVPFVEDLISSQPSVDDAQVSLDVRGNLVIRVTQRKPLVRIINTTGESYYIDDHGTFMPWSSNYTPKVLIVTGMIFESYGNLYKQSIVNIQSDSLLKTSSIMDDIYRMAEYIRKDPFLSAQVMQIHVNQQKEFEMIPRLGSHRILFGGSGNMEDKFSRLKSFYSQGLTRTGEWEMYDTISLQFRNQVVCSKRTL